LYETDSRLSAGDEQKDAAYMLWHAADQTRPPNQSQEDFITDKEGVFAGLYDTLPRDSSLTIVTNSIPVEVVIAG
jgi:hypothetical protein